MCILLFSYTVNIFLQHIFKVTQYSFIIYSKVSTKPGFVDMASEQVKAFAVMVLTCKDVTYFKISKCISDSDMCNAEN